MGFKVIPLASQTSLLELEPAVRECCFKMGKKNIYIDLPFPYMYFSVSTFLEVTEINRWFLREKSLVTIDDLSSCIVCPLPNVGIDGFCCTVTIKTIDFVYEKLISKIFNERFVSWEWVTEAQKILTKDPTLTIRGMIQEDISQLYKWRDDYTIETIHTAPFMQKKFAFQPYQRINSKYFNVPDKYQSELITVDMPLKYAKTSN